MDMSAFILSIISALVTFAGLFFVFVKGKGENANKSREIKSSIDHLIDVKVEKELTRAYTRIEALERGHSELQSQIGKERKARRTLRQVFMAYVERVQTGGDSQLTATEKVELESIEDDDFPTVIPA